MDSDLILEPIKGHLASVEKVLTKQITSKINLSENIVKHLNLKPGKRFRPSIVLLSALSINPKITSRYVHIYKDIIAAAASVELLHNASLIHDDIVDQARLRRGVKPANKIWGDHATVLAGDYLLAKALFLINQCGNANVMSSVTTAASELANGQILDIMISKREVDFNEKIYFQMVNLKTASLISSSSEIGALLANGTRRQISLLKTYGVNLGISYQLIDDVLDFIGNSKKMGKNAMEDIKEGKVTLPVLISLKRSPGRQSQRARKILIEKKINQKNLDFLYNFVMNSKAIEETTKIANNYSLKAISAIGPLGDSKFKDSLINLAKQNLTRVF